MNYVKVCFFVNILFLIVANKISNHLNYIIRFIYFLSKEINMLVTKKAPQFTADAVMPDGSFKQVSLSDYAGKKVLLFFYPLDFTFV